ncbi:MAG: hypothetical protein KBC73_22535, partial [Burkholderiaceae bacterium]|nr:hypothetical protein [Burkholderiaceae bacterium]
KAMVITVQNPCHKLQQGRSLTLVSFQSALRGFAGQFSVGANRLHFNADFMLFTPWFPICTT